MTSITALCDIVINDYLLTGQRALRAKIDPSLNSTVTSVSLTDAQGPVGPGTVLSSGFEEMTVWSGTVSPFTVQRGDLGSTAQAHLQYAIAEINPIFPRSRVLRAIQSEIVSLNADPGIYRIALQEFATTSATKIYDLGNVDVKGVAGVHQLDDGADYDEWVPVNRWSIVRGLTGQTGISADAGIQIDAAYKGYQTRVMVKHPLGSVTSTTSDVEGTTGVPNVRLLAVGAALQLNAGREIKRSFIEHQPNSRRANEVQPFQTLGSQRELQALYRRLKGELQTSLTQKYPARRNRR